MAINPLFQALLAQVAPQAPKRLAPANQAMPLGGNAPMSTFQGQNTPYVPSPAPAFAPQGNPYEADENAIAELIQGIQAATQRANSAPLPPQRRMTGVEALGGALLSILDPRAGAGAFNAFHQAAAQGDERRMQEYAQRQRGVQAEAEGLGQLANYRTQALGRRMGRDEGLRREATEESRFTRGLQNQQDLLGIRNENALAIQALRDENAKSKESEKARAARRRDLTRTLQDPKTTPEARGIARRRLEDEFKEDFSSEEIAALSKPTYVQSGAETRAKVALNKDQREQQLLGPRIKLLQQNAGTSAARAANLARITALLDDRMALELARNDAYVMGVMGGLANQQFGQDIQMRGQDIDLLTSGLSANTSIGNTLRNSLEKVREQMLKTSDQAQIQMLRSQEQGILDRIRQQNRNEEVINRRMQSLRDNAPRRSAPPSSPPKMRGGSLGTGNVGPGAPMEPITPPLPSELRTEPTKPKTKPNAPPAQKKGASSEGSLLGKEAQSAIGKVFAAQAAQLRKDAAAAIKAGAPRDKVNARLKAELAKIGVK